VRRVVVTGMGALSPLGSSVRETWENLLAGKSGVRKITRFDASPLTSQIAGAVPFPGLDDEGGICAEMEDIITAKEQKRMDRFVLYGMYAAHEALSDAGWLNPSDEEKERTGIISGAGCAGISGIEAEVKKLVAGGRASPLFLPRVLGNMFTGQAAMKYGFRRANYLVVSACASGGHAVGLAAEEIRSGRADVMLAGGSEGALCYTSVAGFAAMRALATSYNDRPEEASRPWDRACEGFVIAEGAGLLVLEDLEHARKRGAHIHAEVVGFADSCDAYHVTSPHPDGAMAGQCVSLAMQAAKVSPDQIQHVNAHGTSTPAGDSVELRGLRRAFGSAAGVPLITSTKSSTGHLLGGAGSLELIFAIKSMQDGVVPGTLNTTDLCDEAEGMQIVCGQPRECNVDLALSNSFGFGGANTAIIVKKMT